MYDILIKNGMIVDGSGAPMYQGDVAVTDKKIVAVGEIGEAAAHSVIDASGCLVTPGFIDVNNHSDTYWQLFNCPAQESLLYQGVTTIVGGNSGSSLAPLTHPSVIRSIQKWTDVEKITFNWLSVGEFLAAVERRGLALNFGTLVGHGTLRRGVMKDENRGITPEEIEIMNRLLKKALKEGALGFSTGLLYTHARGAGSRELAALIGTVVRQKGLYATYIRDEEAGLVPAVEEALSLARTTGASVHISHLKAVGQKNWPLMAEAINVIEAAAMSGVTASFDVYPYTSTGSVLYTFLPEWVTDGGRKMMLERLREKSVRDRVIADMRREGIDYSQMLISVSELSRMLARRKISEIAFLQNKSPEETVLDFLVASRGRAIVSLEVLSQKNVDKAVVHPFSIVSTNGVGYARDHAKTGELVHPRNFGTFPRVLREYVREKKMLSWEEAIHKMTGKPAAIFLLEKRGLLRKGNFADIVVFRPEAISDNATMEEPYQYATGVTQVIINGAVALQDGVVQPARNGVVLRKNTSWLRG